MRRWPLWVGLAGCGTASFESPFIDGFEARTSEGGYTDFFTWPEGGCGLKGAVAHCWGTESARTFEGLPVSAFLEPGDVSRPACVLDESGRLHCSDFEVMGWGLEQTSVFGIVWEYGTVEWFCGIDLQGQMRCGGLTSEHGYEGMPVWPEGLRPWRDVTMNWALNQDGELVSVDGEVLATSIDDLRHDVAYDDARVWREDDCLVDRGVLRFDREDNPEREALQDEAVWCWKGPLTRCWETPSLARCEVTRNGYTSAFENAPRPSPTARQLRGFPLCGLEPDGRIACGRWGTEPDGFYAPEAFDLP